MHTRNAQVNIQNLKNEEKDSGRISQGQGLSSRSKVTDVEVSAFSEYFKYHAFVKFSLSSHFHHIVIMIFFQIKFSYFYFFPIYWHPIKLVCIC